MVTDIQNLGGFVWSIAEILCGDFKQSEYGKVILPFVVLSRRDYILESSKVTVLDVAKAWGKKGKTDRHLDEIKEAMQT